MKPSTRLLLVGLLLSLLSQLVPSGARAQTDEIDQLRDERDAVRDERARAAADLDPLIAANEEIDEALRLLTENLSARQAALDATRARLDKARTDVESARTQVAIEQAKIDALRVQLQHQAISAYVQPRPGNDVLSSTDINDGERRRALVSAVSTSRNDILDELRSAEAGMEIALTQAEAAERDIAAREQLAEQQVADVDAAIADQERLREIRETRIAEFQAEVDAHAADEDELTRQLTGLIVEEEARQAAIREAARIQAERERVAAEEARLAAQRAADLAAGRVPEETAVNRAEARLVEAPAAVVGSLIWPTQGTLTSGFGPRWGRQHNGIDVAANTGTNVIAAAAGQVVSAGFNGGFGNMVTIDHGGGLVTVYAHLNSMNVRAGQQVVAGNSVGTVGTTGNSTGPHLHFETRVYGVAYNPIQYLS
ncbi:MAG: peptidoglycan DD-metalloendopeptidase family protein [Actinomycetota bacterium]